VYLVTPAAAAATPAAVSAPLPDEAALATDPLLASLPPARRRTLLAWPDGPGRWRWDLRLQGEDETVFLDL
jgi:protocatechuate 3,4-dioxygenase alpha subunit